MCLQFLLLINLNRKKNHVGLRNSSGIEVSVWGMWSYRKLTWNLFHSQRNGRSALRGFDRSRRNWSFVYLTVSLQCQYNLLSLSLNSKTSQQFSSWSLRRTSVVSPKDQLQRPLLYDTRNQSHLPMDVIGLHQSQQHRDGIDALYRSRSRSEHGENRDDQFSRGTRRDGSALLGIQWWVTRRHWPQ